MPLSYFRRPLALALAAYVAGIVWLGRRGFFQVEAPLAVRAAAAEGGTVRAEGLILSSFSPKRGGDRFWVRLDRTQGMGHAPAKVLAYLSRADPDTAVLRPGWRAAFSGRLRLPLKALRPGGFDERAFLDTRGAGAVFHARQVDILASRPSWRWRPWALGAEVHRSIHGYLRRRFRPERAAILEGLLLGYRAPLPSALSDAVQDAGVAHMLTPSGAKVTLMMAWAWGAGALLRLSRGTRWALAASAGGVYLLVVGPEPPYTRAYGMALALALAHRLGRFSGGFQALILSAWALLLADPRALFSAGFQFTFLAMLGILIALPRWPAPRGWPRWLKHAWRAAAVSLAIQLMLWPAFAAFFGRGSLVGPAANAVLVPASSVIAAAAAAAWAAAGLPWRAPERLAAAGADALAGVFARACLLAAALPGAAVDLSPFGAGRTAAYYLGALGALVLPRWRVSAGLWAGAAAAAGLEASRGPELFRAVLLGRSGSVLALLPDGRRVLWHAGAAPSELRDAFRALGVRRLARVRVSSWAKGPCRSLGPLLRLVRVDAVSLPPGRPPPGPCAAGLKALAAAGVPAPRARAADLVYGEVSLRRPARATHSSYAREDRRAPARRGARGISIVRGGKIEFSIMGFPSAFWVVSDGRQAAIAPHSRYPSLPRGASALRSWRRPQGGAAP